MSSILIVLLCCLGFIIAALVYQQKQQRLAEEYPANEMPLEFVRRPPAATGAGRKTQRVTTVPSNKALAPSFAKEYVRTRNKSSGFSDDDIYVEPGTVKAGAVNVTHDDWSESVLEQSNWSIPGAQTVSAASHRQAPYRGTRKQAGYNASEVRQPPYVIGHSVSSRPHPQSHSVV